MLKILLFVPLWIANRLHELAIAIGEDPLLCAALEADLGVPPGTFRNKDPKSWPDPGPEIRAYITAIDPTAEQLKTTFEAIGRYVKFWKDIIEAAVETGDPSIVADELLYRLLQTTTAELIKFDYPTVYALMRLTGVIVQETRLTLEEVFAPEVGANIFREQYWTGWLDRFEANYLRFRLEQQPDILPPTATPNVRDRQLGLRVFGLSDLAMGVIAYLASRFNNTDLYYGWEIVPRPPAPLCGTQPGRVIPLADHVASRTATVRVSHGGAQATLSQVLFEDPDGRLGWLVALGGSFTAEQKFGPASRPIKVKATLETAGQDASAVLRFSGASSFQGAPGAGLKLEIAPEGTSNQVFAIPDPKGTRLEIGDFKLIGDLNDKLARLRIELHRTALVIVTKEGGALLEETMREKETRIEFDLGLTIDTEHGAYLDSGSRLATTIAVNKAVAGLRVQTVTVALLPDAAEEGHAELRLDTTTAFTLSLGPLTLTVDSIGASFVLGTTKGPAPENSARLMGSLLYIGDAGFLAPKGIGIAVDGDFVKGGGYLFYDRDNEQYAGALQLSLGKRVTLTALGLLTTGEATGFSLLVIASIEFKRALSLPLDIQLNGFGVLIGIHRTMDPEALRAGVRNKTLDAILFPTDVIANAPRYVNALKTVFPPAREHHLFGLTVSLGFPKSQVIRAELAIVWEKGAGGRWALMGQVYAAFPADAPKKLLEMHIDALGLWDTSRGEFSFDGTLYDSFIGPVHFSGDVAVRLRKGDSSFFLFSAGGYHPEFNVPAGFPALRRLTISLADEENLRLKLSGYVAITSNTRQIGARMELFVKIGSLSIEGILSFDALWQPDVRFVVIFDIEFKLKYKGTTFFGVDVAGRFTGPHPKRVVGKWSIDLWLVSIGGSFDHTFGEDRPPAALPAADPLPLLVAALEEPGNWSTDLAGAPTLVTLRGRDGVFVHPLARLTVRQTVVPLSLKIARFAGGTVPGAPRYDITFSTVGGKTATRTLVNDQFAAAEFLDLSDDEKLARPSFEAMPAGVTLDSDDVTFGSQTAVSEMDFDRRVDGAPPSGGTLSGELATFAAGFGAAARSPLRERDVAGQALAVGVERFVVASADDLSPTTIGSGSFAAARQALDAHLATHPDDRLQVVPAFATA